MRLDFTNELGNAISVEVEELPERENVGYVRLVLTGPGSTTENIVTRREAEALLALLQKTLG